MFDMYLTPVSLGYFAQIVLELLILVYLLARARRTDRMDYVVLLGFFFSIFLMSGLFFWQSTLLPPQQGRLTLFEHIPFAFGVIFLLQFAYRYPRVNFLREALAVLVLSMLSALGILGYSLHLFGESEQGQPVGTLLPLSLILWGWVCWIPVVLIRQFYYGLGPEAKRDAFWSEWHSTHNQDQKTLRAFAFIFIFVAFLRLAEIARYFYPIPNVVYGFLFSQGVLIALGLFLFVYFFYRSRTSGLAIKMIVFTVSVFLLALSGMGWIVTPIYSSYHAPQLPAQRSFRFRPNSLGGYDVVSLPFSFFDFRKSEARQLQLANSGEGACSDAVYFRFSYYGETYSSLHICKQGVVSFGQSLDGDTLFSGLHSQPMILPLLMKVESGSVWVLEKPNRLVISWQEMRSNITRDVFYYQLVFHRNGVFEMNQQVVFTEAHSAHQPMYLVDGTPEGYPWMIGIFPPQTHSIQYISFSNLPARNGAQALVQDFSREFREHLHQLLLPVAWLMLFFSFFLAVSLAFLLRRDVSMPLYQLLAGLRQMNEGHLDILLPVQRNDEIGEITQSFNNLMVWLQSLIYQLEERMNERTAQLAEANQRLQEEVFQREAIQGELLQQHRKSAIAEERERMSRDLHDGFGQLLAYINVQAQAAQTLVEENRPQAALANLRLLIQATQTSNHELRHYIFGLRESLKSTANFSDVVQEYLDAFTQAWGVYSRLIRPKQREISLPDSVSDQLLYILQEALINIRKHSHASLVEVTIIFQENAVEMVVSDDGIGFDRQRTPRFPKEHFGLGIMHERARQIGGNLEIRSSPGLGTRISIRVHLTSLHPTISTIASMKGLRVLLVDDQPLFLEGMKNLLLARGLVVVGMANDGLQAYEQAALLHPDLVIMDVNMPVCNGIEATRMIKADFPDMQVILLSAFEEDGDILQAMKYGASGYLPKSLDIEQIFEMVLKSLNGDVQMPPLLAARMLQELNESLAKQGQQKTSMPDLTDRQWDVLRLVASGKTYKEVGLQLSLTERAIKYHMEQILARLQLETRRDAVNFMRRYQKEQNKKT